MAGSIMDIAGCRNLSQHYAVYQFGLYFISVQEFPGNNNTKFRCGDIFKAAAELTDRGRCGRVLRLGVLKPGLAAACSGRLPHALFGFGQ